MKQISGQMSLFDFIEKPKEKEQDLLPCDTCGYDIRGCCAYDYIKNHDYCRLGDKWIPKETIHPVDIMDICDDAYCPVCGDPIDEFKWMDCEKCPSCGARISWEPWHRANDEDNLNLFGENWREKFGKNVKKTKETEK